MSIETILFKSKLCSYCQKIEPLYKEMVALYRDKLSATTVDITENRQIAIDNGVMGIPTIIFYKDKKESKRLIGFVSKEEIEKTIKELL